jgi:hypothetical protein
MTLAKDYFMNLFLGRLGPNEKVTDMGLAITKLPAELAYTYLWAGTLLTNIPLVSEYAIDSEEYV